MPAIDTWHATSGNSVKGRRFVAIRQTSGSARQNGNGIVHFRGYIGENSPL